MTMPYELSYELTERLLDRVSRRFFVHHLDLRMGLLVAAYLVLLAILSTIASPWISGIFVGTALLLFVLMPVAYFIRSRQSHKLLDKLPHRRVQWEIRDDGLRRHTALGDTNWPWGFFDAVVTGPDVWLLLLRRHLAAAIPAEHITPEVAEFMRAHLLAAGVRIAGPK